MKALAVIFICAILVVGSVVEDNFGLTQTRTNIGSSGVLNSNIDLYLLADERPGSGELFLTYPPPPEKIIRQEEFKLPFPPETNAIILTTLFALVLARIHFMPSKREYIPSLSTDELQYPSWKVPFKKYKYHHSGAILPKRHPKYNSRSA